MDGTTPNLNLVKPGENGTADIKVLDQNMEKIDAWAGEKEIELNGKEPAINKNSGFNKEKTDSVTTNSSVILATAKAIKTVWDALTNHRNSTSNPHTVTKSQVGLGNVPNYTITDSTTDGSSLKFGSAKAVKTVWNKALEILGLTNINKNAIQNNTEQIENLSYSEELIPLWVVGDTTTQNISILNEYTEILIVGTGGSSSAGDSFSRRDISYFKIVNNVNGQATIRIYDDYQGNNESARLLKSSNGTTFQVLNGSGLSIRKIFGIKKSLK